MFCCDILKDILKAHIWAKHSKNNTTTLWLFDITMETGPCIDDLWWFNDLTIEDCDFRNVK